MANTKQHPALGRMPKAKGGTNRTVDHGGMGGPVPSVDNTRMNPTAYAGGKGHPAMGSVPKTPNPAPISHNTVGGKPKRAAGW